ncbi:MAG: hypothetical protein ABUL55_03320 [Pseudomonadota bacterium]
MTPHYWFLLAMVIVVGIARFLFQSWWRGQKLGQGWGSEGQLDVDEGAAAFKRRDWDRLVALYRDRSPSDRYHFLQQLGLVTKLDATLPSKPTGDLAVVSAGVQVAWAWRHRGSGLGSTVALKGAIKMKALLLSAEHLLESLEPKLDSVGFALRIRIAQGLDGSRGGLQRQLNGAQALGADQANIFVAFNHILFVTPKWHGSLDEMMAVAREYAAAPENAAWISLPAVAHVEAWIFRTTMDEDAARRADAENYYAESEAFGAEIEALDDAFWAARTTTTKPMAHAELLIAHNYLAFLLYKRRLSARLARHLERVGEDFTRTPWWSYAGFISASDASERVRAAAGLANQAP